VVLLHQVLPGETVKYSIKERSKGILWGETKEVLTPAPGRISPPCEYYGICGGCSFQHIEYSQQLEIKKGIFLENLSRIGGISDWSDQLPIHPSPPFNYRFRAKLKGTTSGKLGFIRKKTTEVIAIDHCLLFPQSINDFLKQWNQQQNPPFFHQVDLNWQPGSQFLYCYLSHPPTPEILSRLKTWRNTSFSWPGNQEESIFKLKIGDWQYLVSPITFFQINYFQWELMLELISNQLIECNTALDLYCGVGFFIPILSRIAKNFTGVENQRLSAQLAQKSFPDASIVQISAEKFESMDSDLVIVDPPRSGLHRKVIDRLIKNKIPRIIYISCSPASLTRDLKQFITHGYYLHHLELFDLFPQTPHIESIATLLKKS